MKIRESGIHGIFGELYVLKPGLVLSEMQKCGAVEVCVVKLCRWWGVHHQSKMKKHPELDPPSPSNVSLIYVRRTTKPHGSHTESADRLTNQSTEQSETIIDREIIKTGK